MIPGTNTMRCRMIQHTYFARQVNPSRGQEKTRKHPRPRGQLVGHAVAEKSEADDEAKRTDRRWYVCATYGNDEPQDGSEPDEAHYLDGIHIQAVRGCRKE